MTKNPLTGGLTNEEKRIVKRLLEKQWRNQDIQHFINQGRAVTVNIGRITDVKKDESQPSATDEELDFFTKKKRSYDPTTGLNFYDDERLIRAREAMILAVQCFNNPGVKFKSEVFSVFANIAWTYLLHEYYDRKHVAILQDDGRSLLLSQMISRSDCPLSEGTRRNLAAIKEIRDNVEHKILRRADDLWLGLFQACCLNFDKTIRELFDEKLTLGRELAFALQFARPNLEQVKELGTYDVPEDLKAVDAHLRRDTHDDQIDSVDFEFQVVYTLLASSPSRAHIRFLHPDSAEGQEISNVLVKHRIADDLYPYKPSEVCSLVKRQTGDKFTMHNHTNAWKYFNIRPSAKAKQPENTNKEYCIYHRSHGDYTYSKKWIGRLVEAMSNNEERKHIKGCVKK